ncbi:hypothetical protein SDC9_171934 [bioreactor metagenome]|uniref:Uncharacterized protein n=1 Tax=bioreactor metagenome TaxID=1076179 RepID=A0A645GCX4_9ZZZZ
MGAAAGFVRRDDDLTVADDRDPGRPATDVDHGPVTDTEHSVRRSRLVDDRGAFDADTFEHVMVSATVADRDTRRDRHGTRAQGASSGRLQTVLEFADNSHRAREIPDDAVAHHIGELIGGSQRLAVLVGDHDHGEGCAEVDPDLDRHSWIDMPGPGQ